MIRFRAESGITTWQLGVVGVAVCTDNFWRQIHQQVDIKPTPVRRFWITCLKDTETGRRISNIRSRDAHRFNQLFNIRVFVVVPCGGPKKSPRTSI